MVRDLAEQESWTLGLRPYRRDVASSLGFQRCCAAWVPLPVNRAGPALDQQSCLPVCGHPSASEETGKMPGAQTCYTLPMGVSARKLMSFAYEDSEKARERCNAGGILTYITFLS